METVMIIIMVLGISTGCLSLSLCICCYIQTRNAYDFSHTTGSAWKNFWGCSNNKLAKELKLTNEILETFKDDALAIEKSRMKLETICEAHMKKVEQNGNQLIQTIENYSESMTISKASGIMPSPIAPFSTGMTFFGEGRNPEPQLSTNTNRPMPKITRIESQLTEELEIERDKNMNLRATIKSLQPKLDINSTSNSPYFGHNPVSPLQDNLQKKMTEFNSPTNNYHFHS